LEDVARGRLSELVATQMVHVTTDSIATIRTAPPYQHWVLLARLRVVQDILATRCASKNILSLWEVLALRHSTNVFPALTAIPPAFASQMLCPRLVLHKLIALLVLVATVITPLELLLVLNLSLSPSAAVLNIKLP